MNTDRADLDDVYGVLVQIRDRIDQSGAASCGPSLIEVIRDAFETRHRNLWDLYMKKRRAETLEHLEELHVIEQQLLNIIETRLRASG